MLNALTTRRAMLGAMAVAPMGLCAGGDWVELFDGRSLEGWRPSENTQSWSVRNGTLAAEGPRSHLFYVGPVKGADFRNFELEVEVRARAGCNSGVYFHTRYQQTGFPEKGFEVQINNTAQGEGNYRERKKTGSLYGLRNVYKQFVQDDQWFKIAVSVRGKHVQVRVDGMLVVDYVEPTPPVIPDGGERERFLDHGTFALQCHNDGSHAYFRSVRVRPLADNVTDANVSAPVVDETYREIINIGRHNVPMVDFDVRLKEGLTIEHACQLSRRGGLEYGVVFAADGSEPKMNQDAAAQRWIAEMKRQPVFLGMQAEGFPGTRRFSPEIAAQFDYMIGGGMSRTNDDGLITNGQQFMDTLVERTVAMLNQEPIDIYADPTYLPPRIGKDYDALWTEDRMKKVIDAAVHNQVAIELNERYRLPSASFVRMAQSAGCKFAFGSNNAGESDLNRRCSYGLQIYRECKLGWQDFFMPGAWAPRAIERKADALRG